MPEYRFEHKDFYATAEFHQDREEADHLNQANHRTRLLEVGELVQDLKDRHNLNSWRDLGCGNGGLLSLVQMNDKIGYDFQPANVSAQRYPVVIEYRDFSNDDCSGIDVVTMTEVLEHMMDPHGFLKNLKCKFLVASVPEGETPHSHYVHHLWGWCRDSFTQMLINADFEIVTQAGGGGTLIVSAKKVIR